MARIDNLEDFLLDVGTSIKTKLGDTTDIPAEEFDAKIASIPSGGIQGYTGSADVEGLKAIGWLDSDIEYFKNCINWDEEDNDKFLVPQIEKDMFADPLVGIADYLAIKKNLKYIPKGKGWTNYIKNETCMDCTNLIGVPANSIKNIFASSSDFTRAFQNCFSLRCVAENITFVNASRFLKLDFMFENCYNLKIPVLSGIGGLNRTTVRYLFYSAGVANRMNNISPISISWTAIGSAYCFSRANVVFDSETTSNFTMSFLSTESSAEGGGEFGRTFMYYPNEHLNMNFYFGAMNNASVLPTLDGFFSHGAMKTITSFTASQVVLGSFASLFERASNLTQIGLSGSTAFNIKVRSTTSTTNMFLNTPNLETIRFVPYNSISFAQNVQLSRDSIIYMFQNIRSGASGQTITLNINSKDKLINAEIAIAVNKGWSVVFTDLA